MSTGSPTQLDLELRTWEPQRETSPALCFPVFQATLPPSLVAIKAQRDKEASGMKLVSVEGAPQTLRLPVGASALSSLFTWQAWRTCSGHVLCWGYKHWPAPAWVLMELSARWGRQTQMAGQQMPVKVNKSTSGG